MPNTPLLIGQGVTAICKNDKVSDTEFAYATSLFECSGYVSIMDENDLCAITAVNGSSPAYFYLFAKSMLDAAHNLALNSNDLLEIVCKTMIGSANMMLSSGKTPEELIQMVKSPNGTTERALNVFENEKFSDIIEKAMQECTKRAIELSKI
jgi:pyrroline-5-carboxylate reductase